MKASALVAVMGAAVSACGSPKSPAAVPPPPDRNSATVGQPLEQPMSSDGGAATPMVSDGGAAAVTTSGPGTFATGRDCASVKAGVAKPIDITKAPAKLRQLTKIGPATKDLFFNADGKLVIYGDPATHQRMMVPVAGGNATPLAQPELAKLSDPTITKLVATWQASTQGDVLPLSTQYLAVGIGDRAEVVRQFIVDVAAGQSTPVAVDGLYSLWSAQRFDDHRAAFIGRDHHMYVADGASKRLVCASVNTTVDIGPMFAGQSEYIVFMVGTELHVADLVAGTDHVVATLPTDTGTVVIRPVPDAPLFWNPPVAAAGSQFVVQVQLRNAKQMVFYLVDAKTSSVERITDLLPGWSNMWVAPDGKHAVFSLGTPTAPAARPGQDKKRPPTPAADGLYTITL